MQIVLSRHKQAELGKRSEAHPAASHHLARLRRKAVEWAREDGSFHDDVQPDRSCLSFSVLRKGMCVIELHRTASGRSGQIVGFRRISGYEERLPLVRWDNGLTSISHPSLLVEQQEQLSLF